MHIEVKDAQKEYELLETLGEGAYGVVRRAKQRRSGKEVAIKIIKKQVSPPSVSAEPALHASTPGPSHTVRGATYPPPMANMGLPLCAAGSAGVSAA